MGKNEVCVGRLAQHADLRFQASIARGELLVVQRSAAKTSDQSPLRQLLQRTRMVASFGMQAYRAAAWVAIVY